MMEMSGTMIEVGSLLNGDRQEHNWAISDNLHSHRLRTALASASMTGHPNNTIVPLPPSTCQWRRQSRNEEGSALSYIMTLNGVGYGNLGSANFAASADPIILDLGAPGISFASANNGVSFDINGDGIKDQVAWTSSNDGILAYDVNGSGTIENGTEIFTPNFAGGNYASGLAALASLDSNADGVINSADTNFGKLLVWQDNNHNGIADPGEVTSLADHGITAINLDATPTDGSIDGQQLQAQGSFSNADGTTGTSLRSPSIRCWGRRQTLRR